jgi:hypothetical protein
MLGLGKDACNDTQNHRKSLGDTRRGIEEEDQKGKGNLGYKKPSKMVV